MSDAMYTALSAVKLKEEELEVVAHNLANATTNGFKENSISFSSILSKYQDPASAQTTPFAAVATESVNFSQGPSIPTGNSLDVALQGNGFLEIQTNAGFLYTRNGALTLDAGGNLVMPDGGKVMGASGAIQITKPGKIQISSSGQITAAGEDQGKIKVVGFDANQLESAGNSLYKPKAGASPHADLETGVLQGNLEGSNTSVMKSLIKLIEVSREYQAYQKVINAQSKMDQDGSSIGKT